MFVVDVRQNNFVSGGRINFVDTRPISSGQDGSGTLYTVIAQNTAITERYNVNFALQGKPLFIALDDGSLSETIEFRDFENGIYYRATLVQSIEGYGAGLRSYFHINLERTAANGQRRDYTVGTIGFRRPMIESYRIRQVMVSPGGESMILVIEMRQREGESTNIRYMVEALRF